MQFPLMGTVRGRDVPGQAKNDANAVKMPEYLIGLRNLLEIRR
jgi:hypothetical protein